jgi:hypothetical protein
MTQITIPELAAICLGPDKSPWSLKDLLGLYKVKTLSLQSLVTKVSAAKAIYYIQVRDLELLQGVSTVAALSDKWSAAVPSRDTLIALNKMLTSAGASIVYISFDWRTVGIYGSFASLMSISGKSVTSPLLTEVAGVDVGFLKDAANGLLVFGAGTAASGFIPEPASPVLIGGGAGLFALGALIKLGVAVFADDDSTNPPGVVPLPTQSGEIPAGVNPADPPTEPIDPASLPDAPPPADANTPVASGGGGGTIGQGSDPDGDPGETQPGVPGDPNAPSGSPTNPSGDGLEGLG